ncbi:MAG: hypothetical protein AAF192_08225 [Pseudomonadota bacterium]
MTDPFAPADRIPARLTAGTRWAWRIASPVTDPAEVSAVWTFVRHDGAGAAFEITATNDGGAYLVEATAAQTAALAAGPYLYAVTLTRTADGLTVAGDSGGVEVVAKLAAGTDRRTFNRRMLDAISATIEGRATTDAESLTIEGRTIAKTPLESLADLRARYARMVAAEERRGSTWRRRPIQLR